MTEMLNRVAMWLHQQQSMEADQGLTAWTDVPDDEKAELMASAKDLLSTIRRPTLAMRVRGRATKGDEADVWRAMVDAAVQGEG